MASVHKDPRGKSPYWYCAFTLPDGTRAFKSTKQTDRQKAMTLCLEWSRASELAHKGALTEIQARKVVSEIIEKVSGEPLTYYTTQDWLMEWLADKEQAKSKSTHLRYQYTVKAFIDHLGKRASLNLAQITPKDIRTFRDAQLKVGKTAQTANLIVKCIRIAFNRAKRLGYISANPAEAIDILPVEKAEKGTFTLEQIAALLKACNHEDWKGAILTAYYTGARLRDVTNLRWESIDLHKKWVEFIPAKTKKKMGTPLHLQLQAFFLKLNVPDNSKAFVFPSLSGKSSGGKSGLSMAFARIMERAGIRPEVVHQGQGKGRSIHTLSFHSLRHSFNSEMANAGISQEIRQKLTGHASAEMNKVYTHHELKVLQEAIATLPLVEME